MNRGPYRYVRHPRYGAAILGKIAMALIFGSAVGWLLAIAWGLLLLNKIEVEEKHLRKVFGTPYESYAQNTAKVIPGDLLEIRIKLHPQRSVLYLLWQDDTRDGTEAHAPSTIGRVQQREIICPCWRNGIAGRMGKL